MSRVLIISLKIVATNVFWYQVYLGIPRLQGARLIVILLTITNGTSPHLDSQEPRQGQDQLYNIDYGK